MKNLNYTNSIITFFVLIFMTACSTQGLKFWVRSSEMISEVSLSLDISRDKNNLNRVIVTEPEFKAFLSSFGSTTDYKLMNIDFVKYNFLIYYAENNKNKTYISKITSSKEDNVTVLIIENSQNNKDIEKINNVFFYKVSKKVKSVTFIVLDKIIKISNKRNKNRVPKECIAWYDGCNHCIRGANKKAMCTRRYCKKYTSFRCVKWR